MVCPRRRGEGKGKCGRGLWVGCKGVGGGRIKGNKTKSKKKKKERGKEERKRRRFVVFDGNKRCCFGSG